MSNDSNPFAPATGSYSTNVSFGGTGLAVPPAGELIKDTTTKGFAADVIQESRQQVVLVDFWAPWCGPCKQLTPILEKVVREAKGRVKLVKMNIDDHPAVAGQLGIQSIPAVIAFKNGQPLDGFMGALPESKVKEFIDRVAGPSAGEIQVEDLLAEARQALDQGDQQTAAAIYSEVLATSPDNIPAIGSLASLLADVGDLATAREILAGVPAGKESDPAIVSATAKIALAEQVSELGDANELRRRIEADEKDHQARFDLAMIQNARGERTEAADNLLAIMKADRAWNDDGARKQLLQLFEAWGMTDDATLAARRKLSSLLFS